MIALCFGLMLMTATGGFDDIHSELEEAAMAVPGNGLIASFFTPEVQYWATDIVRWAGQADLDPNLVSTVMQIESCGNPSALSPAGASGLFQVMPDHFEVFEDPFAPETNALRGLNYLKESLQRANGNPRLALAGYNGGVGVIFRDESTWADETIRYAYWGSGIYGDAANNLGHSWRLDEWLNAGGASLCLQAAQALGLP